MKKHGLSKTRIYRIWSHMKRRCNISMIVTKLSRGASLRSAILLLNNDLSDDGGTGWGFFVCLFLLGLAASFSLARRKGKSISYRLLGRLLQAKT